MADVLYIYYSVTVKVHFQRGRERTPVSAGLKKKKKSRTYSAIAFIPQRATPVETQFDLLLGLGQDTLFACGTGYMVAWRGMGDIPSLEEREQPRPVKVGEGVLQGDMARGSGLSFPWRELEACNKARTCVCPSPVVKEVFFPFSCHKP